MVTAMKLSIIVCTCNRAHAIIPCLDAIAEALAHASADDEPVLRGGRVELGDPNDLPLSIKTIVERMYYQKDRFPAKYRNPAGAVIGANMMMPRSLIDKLGLFDARLGAGTSIPGGEDNDYIFRAYLAGFLIVYEPDMVIFHHHGRRSVTDGYTLMVNYLIASGGLYTKYLFIHPDFCSVIYWDLRNTIREMRSGKSGYMPELGLSYKKLTYLYIIGAVRFCFASIGLSRAYLPIRRTARNALRLRCCRGGRKFISTAPRALATC
jgi:hypothetical protein